MPVIYLLVELTCSRSPKISIQRGWKVLTLSAETCWLWTRTKRGSTSSSLLLLQRAIEDKLEKYAWIYVLGKVWCWGCSFWRLSVLWATHEDSRGIRNCREDDRMISLSKTTDQEILQASMTSALPTQGQTRSSAAPVAISWAIEESK